VTSSRPIVQSTDEQSSTSITLHFDDLFQQQRSTMVFVFVRDQFERYKFLGATRQSYFKIFYSDMNNDDEEHSTLVVRHYSLETLDLLNEQILPINKKWDCLQGFCSTIKQ
jgi:hypothetical protein